MFRNENIRGTGDQNGLNVDVNGPLSIKHLRDLIDAVDIRSTMITPFFLVPKVIMSRIAAAYQEVGFARTNFNYMSQVTIGARDLGMPIMTFDGIPLISTSRLKKEKANTGTTSGIRELDSSSAGVYSIFLITPGMVGSTNGVQLFFGSRNTGSGGGSFGPLPVYRDSFPMLESHDAGAERLITYFNMGHDVPWSIARLYDITDAAVTAT